MNPEEFKREWQAINSCEWGYFNKSQLDKANLLAETRAFLENGLPMNQNRFRLVKTNRILGFERIPTIFYRYMHEEETSNLWAIGEEVFVICVDTNQNDRIIFWPQYDYSKPGEDEYINRNIKEFLLCCLAFERFKFKMIQHHGQILYPGEIPTSDIKHLENDLKAINKNILEESEYWYCEVIYLYD